MVGHMPLEHGIGVRIPAWQPRILNIKTPRNRGVFMWVPKPLPFVALVQKGDIYKSILSPSDA